MPSKLAIFNSVVFFSIVCEQTPPREFVRSASKSISTVRRCCWTLLFATLGQRACPWRVVKFGHFQWNVKLWCHLCHSLTLMLATTSLPVNAPVYRTLHGPRRHYPVATLSTTRPDGLDEVPPKAPWSFNFKLLFSLSYFVHHLCFEFDANCNAMHWGAFFCVKWLLKQKWGWVDQLC